MTDRDFMRISIDRLDPPRLSYNVFRWQNATRIGKRVEQLARNYARGWHCLHCGELMPVWKRIDATYCKEGCRKMAARKRRGNGTRA